jgi:hypothetical protein
MRSDFSWKDDILGGVESKQMTHIQLVIRISRFVPNEITQVHHGGRTFIKTSGSAGDSAVNRAARSYTLSQNALDYFDAR